MNPLLFQCPTTHQPVAVGLRIDFTSLRNVQPVTISLICPRCNEAHAWHLHEGWIEEPPEAERALPPPPPLAAWSPLRADEVEADAVAE